MAPRVPAAEKPASATDRRVSFADIAPGLVVILPFLLLLALVVLVPDRSSEIVALGEALAWPLVVLALAVAFRTEIPELVRNVGGRIKGVSIPAFVTLELVTVPEVSPNWIIPDAGNLDARRLTPAYIFDSPSVALFEQLQEGAGGDFAVVDLGRGEEWVTTRLFIFAVVLERLRQLRCFVFLEANERGRRQWLGVATPEVVHRALAGRYPWLEIALTAADAQSVQAPVADPDPGKSGREAARKLVDAFLRHPEIQQPSPLPQDEWLRVDGPQPMYEHGHWLSGDLVIRDLGKALDQDSWVAEADPAATERAILGRAGPFVGVVRDGGWFVRLVDRGALVERVVERAVAGGG